MRSLQYVGGRQNYGYFLGTLNIPKRDHNFDIHPNWSASPAWPMSFDRFQHPLLLSKSNNRVAVKELKLSYHRVYK